MTDNKYIPADVHLELEQAQEDQMGALQEHQNGLQEKQ